MYISLFPFTPPPWLSPTLSLPLCFTYLSTFFSLSPPFFLHPFTSSFLLTLFSLPYIPPSPSLCLCLTHIRHGLDSNVLRFVAKLNTSNSIDAERQFIVFYHLSDDTITIYEPPVRNSGQITSNT